MYTELPASQDPHPGRTSPIQRARGAAYRRNYYEQVRHSETTRKMSIAVPLSAVRRRLRSRPRQFTLYPAS